MINDTIRPAEIFEFTNKVEYSSNGIVSKRIIQKQVGNVTLFAFDAGQELSEHAAPFDALVQLLEGKGEIIISGISHHLVAGQSIIMPANIPHAVKAHDPFKMLLTMIKQ